MRGGSSEKVCVCLCLCVCLCVRFAKVTLRGVSDRAATGWAGIRCMTKRVQNGSTSKGSDVSRVEEAAPSHTMTASMDTSPAATACSPVRYLGLRVPVLPWLRTAGN
jgi:hypothetical protein